MISRAAKDATLIVRGMLFHNIPRLILALVGVMTAFFLTTSLVGLLIGWCNMTSSIIRHAGADIWLLAPLTNAFDYGTGVPRNYIFRARSVPGVEWAEGMVVDWHYWQRPDGKKIIVTMIGLDHSFVGGPWIMRKGSVSDLQQPRSVIIDQLHLETLGISKPGESAEISGGRVTVVGISEGVRTFTAAPFVFASIETIHQLNTRYTPGEVTYVLVRCRPGADIAQVKKSIATTIPTAEALTAGEFGVRTMRYWILESGAGVTVVACAILGLLVGMVIISQTLYASTLDHIGDYGTLLALGFSRFWLCSVVIVQSLVIGVCGIVMGTGLLFAAMRVSISSSIVVEMTPAVFAGLVLVTLGCCATASFMSVRAVLGIDPVSVFHR